MPSSLAQPDFSKFVFAMRTLEHPKFKESIDKIMQAIYSPCDTAVIHVIGPSGAGKSALRAEVVRKVTKRHAAEMAADRSFIPVAGTELEAAGNKFSWKITYREFLTAMQHIEPLSDDLGLARNKLTTAWRDRRTQVFWIDEAHHLRQGMTSAKALEEQAEVIKSLTQKGRTKLLLFGTQKLLPLVRTNGQIARRSDVIPLLPYGPDDRKTFRNILKYLDETCSASLAISLSDAHDVIYRGCFGFIGVLRDWLVKSWAESDRPGIITEQSLLDATPDPLAIAPNLIEADELRQQFSLSEETAALIDALLTGAPRPKALAPLPQRKQRPGSTGIHRHAIGNPRLKDNSP